MKTIHVVGIVFFFLLNFNANSNEIVKLYPL